MTLLAHYKLDETSGTTVTATVGTNGTKYGGDIVGVGSGNGPGGSLANAGIENDGVDDYINIGQVQSSGTHFQAINNATFACWVKHIKNAGGGSITGFYEGFGGSYDNYILAFADFVTPGAFRWRRRKWNTNATYFDLTLNADSGWADNEWHHVAVCHPSKKIYVDGTDVTSSFTQTGTTASTPANEAKDWLLGAIWLEDGTTAGSFLGGALADARYYASDQSANVASIINDARPTCSVSISGTPNVGELFTATPLTNDSTATFEYQWYRADNASGLNEAAISGATSSTYTTQAADEGKYLRCRGRSTNTGGAGLQSDYEFSDYTAEVTAGGGNHSLTANSLSSGTPALDSPTLTQEHSLTASALTSGTPVFDSPAVSQDGQLTANSLSSGTPTLGSPSLNQNHVLTANVLSAGAPILGSPTLSQAHSLTAFALSAGSPTLGTPALSQTHVLTANPLNAGAPELDSPVLGQPGQLAANPLSSGAPTLGSPALSQIHALGTDGVSAGSPALDSPALAVNSNLVASSLSAGTPTLGSPVLGVDGIISANPLTTGSPTLGSPALSQTHVLSILSLTTGVPALGRPILNWDQIPYTPSYLRTFYPSISLPERTVPQLSFGSRTFSLPGYTSRTFLQIPYDNRTGIPYGS